MFVRTDENNIHEIDNDSYYIKDGYLYFKGIEEILGGTPEEYKSKIVKQADNIEELCDEALFFNKEGKPNYRSNQSVTYWNLGANLFRDSVRFAIFTGTGLKYVAKLNKEGDVELL